MIRCRAATLVTVIVLLMAVVPVPVWACNFEEIPYAEDWTGSVEGSSSLADGSDTSAEYWASTHCFSVSDIGVRLSLYKYDGSVLRFVHSETSPQSAGDWATVDSTDEDVETSYEGCWHGQGYHWAYFGGGQKGCATLSIWHIEDKCPGYGYDAKATRDSLAYAVGLDTEVAGIDGDWDIVGFEDFNDIIKLMGVSEGGDLAHFLYVTGADTFRLSHGDLQPAVYISPSRTKAVVGMFGPSGQRVTLIPVCIDGDGNWKQAATPLCFEVLGR